jgi:tetratricopeptide (TPR) repeat protein
MKKHGWEFQTAWAAFNAGKDYAAIIDVFERHFQKHEDIDSLVAFLGCCQNLKDFERGLAFVVPLQTSFVNDKRFLEALFRLRYECGIENNIKTGNWSQASEKLEWIKNSSYPVPDKFRMKLACDSFFIAFYSENYRQCIEEFEQIKISDLPKNQQNRILQSLKISFFRLLKYQIRNNEWLEVGNTCEAAERFFPREVDLQRKKAFALFKLGEVDQAVNLLKKAVNERSPWEVSYELSLYYLHKKAIDESFSFAIDAGVRKGSWLKKINLLQHLAGLYERKGDNESTVLMRCFIFRLKEDAGLPVDYELEKKLAKTDIEWRFMQLQETRALVEAILREENTGQTNENAGREELALWYQSFFRE